jgi:hypothetical protein
MGDTSAPSNIIPSILAAGDIKKPHSSMQDTADDMSDGHVAIGGGEIGEPTIV